MAEAANCPRCGKPVPARSGGRGRPSRWCSDACRKAGHRAGKAPAGPKAPTAADRRSALLELLAAAVLPEGLAAAVAEADEALLARIEREVKAAVSVSRRLRGLLPAPAAPVHAAAEVPALPAVRVPVAAPVPAAAPEPTQAEKDKALADWLEATDPFKDLRADPEPVPTRGFVAPQRTATKTRATARRGAIRPTAEQEAIIEACLTGETVVIEAGAGTGKTSTLKMVAERRGGRGLYAAFNKPIVLAAKKDFPGHIACRTSHSLAYAAVGSAYSGRLDGPRQDADRSAQLLGVTTSAEIGAAVLGPASLTRHALETVKKYCYSAEDEIQARHVPRMTGVDEPEEREQLAEAVLPIARQAWEDLQHRAGKLHFTHDHYFKIWALGNPRLNWDYIYLDEAQDTNPAWAKIVREQDAQSIVVGDSNQAIYAWRGATDALASWPARHRLMLSKSWRFGRVVADEANKWLEVLGSRMRLTGNEAMASRLNALGVRGADAVLCRTNGEAIRQSIAAMGAGRRVALVGGTKDVENMAKAARDLQAGKATSHPELCMFPTWNAVRAYAEQDAAGSDLRVWVRLIEDYGPDEVIRITGKMTGSEQSADMVISTAHKAKGREWEHVMIGTDFREPKRNEDGTPGSVKRDEAHLAYVAVTRAREVLDREGLAWVDTYINGSGRRGAQRGVLESGFDLETAPW